MTLTGWIKLHRKLTEWEWYHDGNTFRVFMHLLLTANHNAKKYRGHEIQAGCSVSGRKALAAELGLSEQQVRTSLDKLKSTNEITIKTTNKFSIISITSWEKYQVDQPTDNQQSTSNQPTDNQQVTTPEECKKGRREEAAAARETAAPDFNSVGDRCLRAMGIDPRDPTWFGNKGIVAQWLANGWNPDTDILPTIQTVMQRRNANGQGVPRSLNFFTNAIGEAFKARKAASGSNVVGIQPETEMCELANGKTIPRGVAYVRCYHYFLRVKNRERCPWTPTQQLEDKYPPGHPDSIYPQEIVDEAREAVEAEAKQQAAG